MTEHRNQQRDQLGERIYARHARFVWPNSMASFLARRFAPLANERLSLAAIVQRRWPVANLWKSKRQDSALLLDFGPDSPRYAGSAGAHKASRAMVRSVSKSGASSPGTGSGLRPASETTFGPASRIASAANTFEEPGSGLSRASSNVRHTSLEDPGQIESAFSSGQDRTLSSLVHTSHDSKIVQAGASSKTEASDGHVDGIDTNIARLPHNAGGQGSSSPVAVYTARPILRRSSAARGGEAARVDRAGQRVSSSSIDLERLTTGDGATEVQASTEGVDQATARNLSPRGESVPMDFTVERPIASQESRPAVTHVGLDSRGSRIQSAAANQSDAQADGQSHFVPAAQAAVQSAGAPGVTEVATPHLIVSRELARESAPLIMRQSPGTNSRLHEAVAHPALEAEATAQLNLSPLTPKEGLHGPASTSGEKHDVPNEAQVRRLVQLIPEDSTRGYGAATEDHGVAPATPMLHLKQETVPEQKVGEGKNAASSSSPLILEAERYPSTGRGLAQSFPGGVAGEDRAAFAPTPVVHLKRDAASPEISLAASGNATPMNLAEEKVLNLRAIARIQESNSPVVSASHPNHHLSSGTPDLQHRPAAKVSQAKLLQASSSEPAFRSAGSPGLSTSVGAQAVVQESAVENLGRREPFVSGHHILPGVAFRAPAGASGSSGQSTSLGAQAVVQESAIENLGRREPFVSGHHILPGVAFRAPAGGSGSSGQSTSLGAQAVVQESAIEKLGRREPFVLSHHILPGVAFRAPAGASFDHECWPAVTASASTATIQGQGFIHSSPATIARSPAPPSVGNFATMQAPSSAAATSVPRARVGALPASDINQLANRVYEMLVRRLSSERQRRGH